MRHALPLLLLSFLSLGSTAQGFDDSALRVLLETERVEKRMPGLRAAVRTPDGRLYTAAVGLADRKSETPLDDTIGMPGGSTGKTFVAALTLLLVEDGAIGLDDLASKWLGEEPWFQRLPGSASIRVRHLLSHSSGIADYPGTIGFQRKMIWRVIRHGSAYFEPEELIAFARDKRSRFAPGEGYRYTDAGYLVLGRLIEAATGRTYFELLEDRILRPLELDGIRPQLEAALPAIATGYSGGGSILRKDGRMKFDPRSEWTGGGLVTTPSMLVRFYAALAEGRLLTPASVELMLTGGWQNPDEPDWRYGYGVFLHHPTRSYGHGGLWPGYRTHVAHYRDRGLTIAVQTNRDGRLDLEGLVARIAAAVPENE